MGRFIEGCERRQALLLVDCVDDYVGAENPVRVIDVFVDELNLAAIGFEGAAATGRPGYHPATLLKLYLWLHEPSAVEPAPRTRGEPQCRGHVADPQARPRLANSDMMMLLRTALNRERSDKPLRD